MPFPPKKRTLAAVAPKPPAPPTAADPALFDQGAGLPADKFLSPLQLLEVRALQAELALAMAQKDASEAVWKSKIYEQAEVIRKMSQVIEMANRQWLAAVERIEKEHDISMREHTYDTQTGKLNRL